MNYLLQRILKPVLIILAILALIASGIVIFIDPNHYKHQISTLVYKQTGRNLTIDGDIKWKLTPNIAISIQNIKLNNPPGFNGDFLTAEEARVKLNLFGLLFGKVSISGVELQSPKVNLINLKSGKSNFAEQTVSVPPMIAAATVATDSSKSSHHLPTIKINRININNATITWEDQSSNQHLQATNLNIQAKNLNLNSPNDIGPILLSATVTNLNNTQPNSALLSPLQVELTATANIKNKQLSVNPLTITIGPNSINAKWNTIYAGNTVTINDLTLESAAGIITGKLHAILPANALPDNATTSQIVENNNASTTPSKNLQISGELHGKTIAVDKFLQLLGQAPQLSGTSDFDLTIETKGQQTEQFKRNLNSKLYLAINDGKITGADLHQIFRQAEDSLNTMYNTLKQSKTTSISSLLTTDVLNFANLKDKNPLSATAYTSFDKLNLAATLNNGVSKNINCNITHRDYNITGNGEINLPSNNVAMNINALYQGDTQAKSSEIVEYILHTPLVILVRGNISEPHVTLDMQAYMQAALQQLQRNLLKDFAKNLIHKIIPGMQDNTGNTADTDSNQPNSIYDSASASTGDNNLASDNQAPPANTTPDPAKDINKLGQQLINSLLKKSE